MLVAGKGHEQGQIVGSGDDMRVLPFDDVTVARECAAAERGMSRHLAPCAPGRARSATALRLALWTADEIAAATGGTASGAFQCAGVEIDSRDVRSGDLFVALKGEATDGHRFVDKAFANGAAAALVERAGRLAARARRRYRRARSPRLPRRRANARSAMRIGVTGSVGKTGVKEAIFAALDRASRGAAHRSRAQLQQPCRRAAQPRADARAQPVRRVRDGHEPRGRDRRR